MNATVICCPLLDCGWSLDATPPEVPVDALAGVFGTGVMTAVGTHQHAHRVEADLRAHYRTHDAAQFLATITALAKERDGLRAERDRLAETVQRVRTLARGYSGIRGAKWADVVLDQLAETLDGGAR